jgi:hypothetical protein
LTLVSTVSTVSRVCRESVEGVEPGLKVFHGPGPSASLHSHAKSPERRTGTSGKSTNLHLYGFRWPRAAVITLALARDGFRWPRAAVIMLGGGVAEM